MHRALASHFPRLQARTVSIEGEHGQQQAIDVRLKPSNKRKSAGGSGNCDSHVHMYLHFTVIKQNTEHFHGVSRVATAMNVSSSVPTYAGMKDKQAITCQRFSIPLPPIPFHTSLTGDQEKDFIKGCSEAATRAAEKLVSHFKDDRALITKDPSALCRARMDAKMKVHMIICRLQ